jgi:hypothetical protein
VRDCRLPLSISRVAEAGEDVYVRQVRIVRNDLFFGHSRGEIRQDIVDPDAQASDARLTATLVWLNGNDPL